MTGRVRRIRQLSDGRPNPARGAMPNRSIGEAAAPTNVEDVSVPDPKHSVVSINPRELTGDRMFPEYFLLLSSKCSAKFKYWIAEQRGRIVSFAGRREWARTVA